MPDQPQEKEPPYSIQVAGALLTLLEAARGGLLRLEERAELFQAGMALYRSVVLMEAIDVMLGAPQLHFPGALRFALKEMMRRELGDFRNKQDRLGEWSYKILDAMEMHRPIIDANIRSRAKKEGRQEDEQELLRRWQRWREEDEKLRAVGAQLRKELRPDQDHK